MGVAEIHSKLNVLRAINRLINSELFISILACSSEEKQNEVKQFIEKENIGGLKSWLKQNRTEPENMSIRDLRSKAKWLGVKNYSCMTKQQLIDALNSP